MGLFVLRRLGVMLLTALALTFVVFYLTNLQPNLEKLARTEGSVRMTDQAVQDWIAQNGHSGSVFARYGQWLGIVPGWTYTDEKARPADDASRSARTRRQPPAIAGCCRATGASRPSSRNRLRNHWSANLRQPDG